MEQNFYDIGWETSTKFMYGNESQKLEAEQIYDRFCSQQDNENKRNFICGWTDHLMD